MAQIALYFCFPSPGADLPNRLQDPVRLYTYPMAVMADAPPLLNRDEIGRLEITFMKTFKRHIFMPLIDIPASSQGLSPPYLELSLACLASAVSQESIKGEAIYRMTPVSSPDTTHRLFSGAIQLMTVMLEVDNRQARLMETIMAVSPSF